MDLEEARALFSYDSWANALILEAAARLPDDALRRDFQTSHRNLFETLVHVVAAEEILVVPLEGRPPGEAHRAR